MYQLFRIDGISVALGTIAFSALFLVATIIINVLPNFSISNDATVRTIIGLLGMALFPIAGYFVAHRTHPSGVFDAAVVGIAAGILTVLFTRIMFGEFPQVYSNVIGILGGIGTSLLLCAFGGLLGSITMHYKRK